MRSPASRRLLWIALVLTIGITSINPAFAQRGRGRGFPPLGPATEAAEPFAMNRHEDFLAIAGAGGIDLLFVGDSITDWWARDGEALWNEHFAPLNAANFGIAGDTTQGVLWRMQNGELEGFEAGLIVHMLGTNNINRNENADIVAGNAAIIEEYRERQPQAPVLVLGVFPRGAEAATPMRASIAEINQGLEELAESDPNVHFMDIGDAFLEPDGTLSTAVFPDGLHPNAEGYRRWAGAIGETVRRLMSPEAGDAPR
jgi:lysophospholipase L1-like esterase